MARDALETPEEKAELDALNVGVPMRPPTGPATGGPEDALDPNARGDYSNRIGEGVITTTEYIEGATYGEAHSRVVDQGEIVRKRNAAG